MATREASRYVRSSSFRDPLKNPAVTFTLSPILPSLARTHLTPVSHGETGPVTTLQRGLESVFLHPLSQICGSQSSHRQSSDYGIKTLDFSSISGSRRRRGKKHRRRKLPAEHGTWAVAVEAALYVSTSDPSIREPPTFPEKHSNITGISEVQSEASTSVNRKWGSRCCSACDRIDGNATETTISAWTVLLSVREDSHAVHHSLGEKVDSSRETLSHQTSYFCGGDRQQQLSPAATGSQMCSSLADTCSCAPDGSSGRSDLVTTSVQSGVSQRGAASLIHADSTVAGDSSIGSYQHLSEFGRKLRRLQTRTALTGLGCLIADVDTESTHTAEGCDDYPAVTSPDRTSGTQELWSERGDSTGEEVSAGAVGWQSGREIGSKESSNGASLTPSSLAGDAWSQHGTILLTDGWQDIPVLRLTHRVVASMTQCADKLPRSRLGEGSSSCRQGELEKSEFGGWSPEVDEVSSSVDSGAENTVAQAQAAMEACALTSSFSFSNLRIHAASQAGIRRSAAFTAQKWPDLQLAAGCDTGGAVPASQELVVCPLPPLLDEGELEPEVPQAEWETVRVQ